MTKDFETLSTKYADLESKHSNLEKDILKIDVSHPGSFQKKSIIVTDSMVMKTLGR